MAGHRHVGFGARIGLTLAAVAALSSCVRVTSDSTFSDHDTVSQVTIIAVEPAAAAQAGIDLDELTAERFAELFPADVIDPAKVRIEDYTEDEMTGVRIDVTDATFAEVASLGDAIASTSGGLGGAVTVSRDGDEYVVEIAPVEIPSDAEGQSEGDGAAPTDALGQLGGLDQLGGLGAIASSVNVATTFTFPGPVVSASGGDVSGKRVTLGLEELLSGEPIVIRGSAEQGIAWGPWLRWIGIGAVAVVIIGGASLLAWRDRRKRHTTNLPPIPETVARVTRGR